MDKELLQFLARFIIESDAIENITADRRLVELQLENGATEGHVGALLLMESLAKKKELLTEDIVCRVQGLITAEQHTKPGGPALKPEYIGKYRNVGVRVGGRIAPSPSLVPSRMYSWMSRVIAWHSFVSDSDSPTANLHSVADLHFEYEFIHPFADGNGRSGRALVYYLLRERGITPFVFTSGDKRETYYQCFQKTEAMRAYFESRVNAVA